MLADLKHTSPDLILHGGDLADSGSSPRQIVDCIRDLSWPGVIGNTDELLASPKSLQARGLLVPVIEEMAAATRDALGDERLNWLGSLPARANPRCISLGSCQSRQSLAVPPK